MNNASTKIQTGGVIEWDVNDIIEWNPEDASEEEEQTQVVYPDSDLVLQCGRWNTGKEGY